MAKSRSIGGIYASLTLRDRGFKSGLKSAGAALKKFGVMAGAAAAAGAAAGAAALTAGTLRTLDQVDALGDLSAQTGVAIGDMMRLQQAYKEGGRAAEMAGKDIGKMQKSLITAASGGDDPFTAMGLSARELLEMDPAEQFNAIGEAILKIKNPAERTAKAMEIFGKGGMGLTTVFEGIPAAAIALGRMPEIAAEFGARMGEANDLIGNLPLKSDQFFMGFTAGIVDSILPGLNLINQQDFTTMGQTLGNALVWGVEMAGDVFNVWAATINSAFDYWSSVFSGESFNMDDTWNKYITTGQEALDKLFTPQIKQSPEPPANRDLTDNIAAAAKEMKPAKAPELITPNFDEYQRRGLQVSGGSESAKSALKQIDILTDMRTSLKKMAEGNGQLVWGK